MSKEEEIEALCAAADKILGHIIEIAPYRAENRAAIEKAKTKTPEDKAFHQAWCLHFCAPTLSLADEEEKFNRKLDRSKACQLITELGASSSPLPHHAEEEFTKAFIAYQAVLRSLCGVCEILSYAGLFYALTTLSDIRVTLMSGADDGFDHAFLVLGELPDGLPETFDLRTLPNTCLIVDPWTDRKFLPEQMEEEWRDVKEKFAWTSWETRINCSLIASTVLADNLTALIEVLAIPRRGTTATKP